MKEYTPIAPKESKKRALRAEQEKEEDDHHEEADAFSFDPANNRADMAKHEDAEHNVERPAKVSKTQ